MLDRLPRQDCRARLVLAAQAALLLAGFALGGIGGSGDWERASAQGGARVAAVSAGWAHTCALLETGEVTCWGDDSRGQADAPAGRFVSVGVAWGHGCALRESGEARCWGTDGWGQVNLPDGRFSTVSVGARQSCGLRESGEVECWGENEYGQMDAPSERFTQVSVGDGCTCGLTEAGGVRCWGVTTIRLPASLGRVGAAVDR